MGAVIAGGVGCNCRDSPVGIQVWGRPGYSSLTPGHQVEASGGQMWGKDTWQPVCRCEIDHTGALDIVAS